MPRAGFYNDNEYRAYPFVFDANFNDIVLPNATIVDVSIIMGLMSGFDPTQHSVWLESISRTDDVFTFSFRTDAPGAASQPLTFTRPVDATEWLSEQIEGTNWEGFFVTGPLTDLAAQLDNGDELALTSTNRVLEPARVQSLVKSYLRSVSLGNYKRTMVTPSAVCVDESTATNNREIIVNAEGLQGNLRLKEGYNCRINQTDFDNTLRVAAALGSGLRPDNVLCNNGGELVMYEGETAPPGSKFLSGGPACDETISTINGVGGSDVTFVGGSGIKITVDNETATITVALDKNNLVGNCA